MVRFIYFGLIFLTLASCASMKKNTTSEKKNNVVKTKTHEYIALTATEKRKFDYFFYEAQRLKVHGDFEKSKDYYVECLKIDPNSSVCYYELSNIAILAKKYKAAQELLAQAVSINDSNKYYQILLGKLYQQNGDIKNAILVHKKLNKQYPDNVEYMYVLSQLYTANKQYTESIGALNKLEKQMGLNEMISIQKEKLYLQIGDKKSAYKEINSLIKSNPKEPHYYGLLGNLYMYNKNLDKAEESYKKILKLNPNSGLGFFSLANIQLQKKDTTGFFNFYDKALQDKDLDIQIKLQRVLPFLVSKDFNNYKDSVRILNLFKGLVKVHPKDARSYYYYANYLKIKGENLQAIAQYKLGLKYNPSDAAIWQDLLSMEISLQNVNLLYTDSKEALKHYPNEAIFCFFHGIACMELEKLEEAKVILEHGLTTTDKNIKLKGQIYASLGDVYYSLKDNDNTFRCYDEALKIDEHNVVVLNNYSYYLSVENKDLDKAEKMTAKTVELEPENNTYLDTYAWVLFKRGHFLEAKYIIERAIDNGGDKSDVVVEHYGDILFKNNDVKGAVKQWKKSREMGNKSKVLIKKIDSESYIEE